ncbi:nicotinate-nucleotide--dimethylbenzimidazole phosphoribosyltransferase [Streptomyces sp. TLI_146]|uniref:nicotinate-nucleotide--dimethylbenzimidazole phosphoribosyltransferase n=1 Tax=Streptomyces sp. TLI_146 TaxID=1938858 RepID=UPI000C70F4E7|nr:nicotinate-nucleotide--dimethylbenzimidazole phosphoribosyltransferase [Streptomyces sp. TLI_146]PKV84703.1 nicotinate-nucleotide-dimethylbenzimidazole phosphoribosyltransferase /cob(II)yrinic acid a,c-diamide reductase [Streptomyces sp. TLI_146]
MTDTGQVPGEGLPEDAGMVEQPGVPAPGAYTFLDPSDGSALGADDDDLLLMPGAQGAWIDPQSAPAPLAAPMPAPAHAAPAPEQPAEPGAHEAGGRDSGSVDLGAVRTAPATPQPARRPLHMGPPVPDAAGGVVRSLADRGPAAGAPANPAPVRTPGPPTTGPEYLDVPREEAAAPPSGPQLSELPPQGATPWEPMAPHEAVLAPAPQPAPQPAERVRQPEPVRAEAAAPQAVQPQQSLAQPEPQQSPNDLVSPAETVVPEELAPAGVPAQAVAAEQPSPVMAPVSPVSPVMPAPAVQPPAVGQFVPVEGSVPTGPHLAPSPVEPVEQVAVPVAEHAPVPEPVAAPAAEPVAGPVVAAASAEPTSQAAQPQPVQPAQPSQPEGVQAEPVAEAAVEPVAPVAVAPVAVEEAEDAVAEPVAPAPEPVAVEAAAAVAPEAAEPVAAPAPAEPVAEVQEQAQEQTHAQVQVQVEPDAAEPQPAPVPAAATPVVPVPRSEEPLPEPQPETVPAAPEAPAPLLVTDEAEPLPAEAAPEQAAPVPVIIEDDEDAAEELAAPAAETVEQPEPLPADAAPETEGADGEDAFAEPGAPAPGYADAEREAVLRVMRERRDIRNGFRGDPIPHEVLLRVLEAAHTAPSVGHSQPWDFVVIRSAETRRTMHELAQRQRDAYAKSLPKGRAKQFKELKIEAILDTPVNIVVTADPTRGGRHTLGRYTQPQMAPYSSALAVENLWLAARAEGLGVGWVSFFDEREMVRALGLPEHLEVVAYLCVGYVDEFPEEPELMQAGWSKRRPLSWVVHEETYGRRALPGEEPHDLLQETVANIRPLDAKALGEAWERQKRMTKPAGALGMLEIISAQLSGLSRKCPPPIPEPAAVAIFAGDHGVHAQGVTPWPQEVTGQMVANFLGGGAVCNAFANQVGAEVCVIDVGVAGELPATPGLLPRKVRPGTGDMTTGPAMTREEVVAAVEVGIETARDLVAAGNKALLTGEMGIANTTVSAALISLYTGVDPAEVTGRGTGINDETHARKVDVVRRALELHSPDPADPIGVLAGIGGLEHAAMVGFILGGASLRTPVILDGVSAGAAALVARAIAPEALAACIAGHRSAEPGHVAALNKLGLRPLVDLDLRLGEGTGALLALPLVQSAARAMHEVATFDSAGVTEK